MKAVVLTAAVVLCVVLTVPGCGSEPSTPMNLTAETLSASEILLAWNASEDSDSDNLIYRIYRDGELVIGTTELTATDAGLLPATEYCYTVEAADLGLLISGPSNEACATTLPDTEPPSSPENLTAEALSATEISLEWDAATDDIAVTGYNVFRNGALLISVETTMTTDAGLDPGTEYCYTVTAFDEAGNESGVSAEVCATTESEI